MRVTLNLATRPYIDIGPAVKRLRIAMAVLVVLGGALLLGLRAVHQKAEEARATEQKVQTRIDAINRERQGYQDRMRQPANAQLLTQVGALNQFFDEKTFSWTLAMEDLETVLPGGVQVVSLDPSRDSKTGRITLKLHVVGARDRADDLVENLEHSRHFLLPHIVSESSDSTGGPNERFEPVSASNRFNFELLAEYNPAAPVDRKAEKAQQEETRHEEIKHEKVSRAPKPTANGQRALPPVLPSVLPNAPQRRLAPPLNVPPAPGMAPGRPPYTGTLPARPGPYPNRIPSQFPVPNRNPNSYPNPNQNPIPNPNSHPGGPQ
jgi:type IV pilus assembly protein PilN